MNRTKKIEEKFKFSNKKKYEKLMLLTAFILLFIATIISFKNKNFLPTIIPFRAIIVPIINATSALLCFILLFIKEYYRLQCLILFVQGICTALTGYELLGAFLYSAMFVLLFVNKFFTNKPKKKLIFLVSVWILTNFSLLPISKLRFLIAFVISSFFAAFYAYVFKKLEDILSVFIPAKKSIIPSENFPKQGEELILKDFNLSERQITILKDFIENKTTYLDLARKYNISISTVKKEMSEIFTRFNVTNNNELYILLKQFVIK